MPDRRYGAMRKLWVMMCLVHIVFFSLFADSGQESAGNDAWWIGKSIASFSYDGLQNVDASLVADITYEYEGRSFSNDLFSELEEKLYELNVFSYFVVSVEESEENPSEITLAFDFVEFPQIKEIVFTGNSQVKAKTLGDGLEISVGDFFTEFTVSEMAGSISDLYKTKGFADASVDGASELDDARNTVSLAFAIQEGLRVRVRETVFEGITVKDRDVGRQLVTRKKSLFNAGNFQESTLREDSSALLEYYQNRGYLDAKITDIRQETIETDEKNRDIRLVYVIEEGAQWTLGTITVTGNTIFADEEIRALLTLDSGSILNMGAVNTRISQVADLYWNEGYVYNTVNTDMVRHEDSHSIDFTVTITERPQALIEDIVINGLTKTKPYVLFREMTVKKGDVFSKAKLEQSMQNMYNTGLLEDLKYDILYGSEDNQVVLEFTAVEGNHMSLSLGATFGGNTEGFPVSGFLSWDNSNLWGTARDLTVATELNSTEQAVSVSLSDGWVGDKRWSNALSLSFTHTFTEEGLMVNPDNPVQYYWATDGTAYPAGYDSYEAYEEADFETPDDEHLMDYDYYRLALGYTTGYTFMFDAGRLTASAGVSIGINHAAYDDSLTPFERILSEYHEGWRWSNKATLSLVWDGRDLIENTTKGYMLSQSFTYAGGVLGGLSNYMKTTTSASGYATLFETSGENPFRGVLSLTSTLSAMLPQYWNNDGASAWYAARDGATKYEMIYLDGMTTGRGFDPVYYNSLMWDNTLELSMPIVKNLLWGEVFTSATGLYKGDVSDIGSLSALNWYFSGGAGIKLKIPGFPLGLYIVKNATLKSGESFQWDDGTLLGGTKIVLAITTSLY